MIAILYYGTVVGILLYLIAIFLYIISLIISALDGAPYVKIDNKSREILLKHALLSKKSHLVEVGSGTGNFTFYVQEKYGCRVTGIEINPFLHKIALIRQAIRKNSKTSFVRHNALSFNYAEATHVYVFLLPAIIRKLSPQLINTCKKGTIIISYGFCIPTFKKYLKKKIERKPYPIYYYKL